MSEGRGLTLRKKRKERPVISGPQPTTTPSTTRPAPQQNKSNSSLAVPRERNAPTETSDLVKRRYSTRYNQLPDFSNIDTPDVPIIPGALKRSSRGGSPRRKNVLSISSQPVKVDQDILSDPNLQHERYVTDLLSNASEQDIQEYQNSLRRIKHRNSTDLQQSVYQNRTQFIRISKEVEKLNTEMGVLKALMGELTGAIAHTQSTTTNGTSGNNGTSSRRNANRTSVANLENMWNIQLQALWKNVEKSQKFLPAIPGRHIVMENGQWIELDSATWKPKRPVHVVLLNDHLLVASKKRKRVDPNVPQQGPAPTKLVAEECWSLLDIDLVDMSATTTSASTPTEERAIATAITVRTGGRSLTYRHEKRDEKAKNDLLVTFRKAAEDLRKANKIDTDTTSPHTDSLNYFASRDPASAKNADILESLNSAKEKPDILIEVDGKQQNFRWVEGQIDDLDIDVALQRFDEAVAKVEQLRGIAKSLKSNSIAQDLIQVKVEERALKLSQTLIRELIETPSFASATKRTVSFLSRLGFEDAARTAFLQSRSDELIKRSRQCVFEGDLHRYVFSLAFVYFTMIKNTVVIYQSSFSSVTISAVIKWSNEHLENFNALLVRQLSSVERAGKVWRACMDVVWDHERSLLGEVGLDFREVIGRSLEVRDIPFVRPNALARTVSTESTGAGAGMNGRMNGNADREQSRSKSRARNGPGAWPEQ